MPNRISIALVGQALQHKNKDANLRMMEQALIEEDETDLFVFPEVNIIGGFWRRGELDYPSLSEKVPEGESCARVINLARKYRTTICAGLIEASEGRYFVTHFLCDPEGYIGKQRKLYPLSTPEEGFFSNGTELHIFSLFGHGCVILACADFFVPEATVLAGLSEAALIISPVMYFKERHLQRVEGLLSSRSRDARAHAVVAFGHDPRAKEEAHLVGVVAGPSGDILASGTREPAESKIIRSDLELKVPRKRWGGFQGRSKVLLNHLLKYHSSDNFGTTNG